MSEPLRTPSVAELLEIQRELRKISEALEVLAQKLVVFGQWNPENGPQTPVLAENPTSVVH